MGKVVIASNKNEITVISNAGSSAADVSASIAVHNALATGVHGVGASTVASAADVSGAVGAHALLETAHSLTANFIDAMQAANAPTAANPFVTQTALTNIYSNKVLALAPIVYWKLTEPVGTTGANSVLDATGNSRTGTPTAVSFGLTGMGDGNSAAWLNGSSSLINVYTASLVAAFNTAEFTISGWLRPDTLGLWSDGGNRHVCMFSVDGGFTNYVRIYKSAATNYLSAEYVAGSTNRDAHIPNQTFTTWMHMALVVSKAGDYLRFYLDGIQHTADNTGLGTFVGTFGSTFCMLGAIQSAGGQNWSGGLQHVAIFNRPLSAAEVSSLANF